MSVSPLDWIPLFYSRDTPNSALREFAQNREAISVINYEFLYRGHHFRGVLDFAVMYRMPPLEISFLLDMCGAKMWNNILEQDTLVETMEILHDRGARFKSGERCFRYACGIFRRQNFETAVTFMVQYPQFWDTDPRKCILFEDSHYELTETIIDIARHRSERTRKARMAMLSLTYGGTKHLSKDMLRLVIGYMKNPNYVANPVWGTPWWIIVKDVYTSNIELVVLSVLTILSMGYFFWARAEKNFYLFP
jgi:hypothetical protein